VQSPIERLPAFWENNAGEMDSSRLLKIVAALTLNGVASRGSPEMHGHNRPIILKDARGVKLDFLTAHARNAIITDSWNVNYRD
jgi:hypothetical protein